MFYSFGLMESMSDSDWVPFCRGISGRRQIFLRKRNKNMELVYIVTREYMEVLSFCSAFIRVKRLNGKTILLKKREQQQLH